VLTDEGVNREIGINCGLEFMKVCDEVWIFIENGKTEGMLQEEKHARKLGKKIKYIGAL
jgi:hypothetical protein